LIEEVGVLRTRVSIYRASLAYDSRLAPPCAAAQVTPTILTDYPTLSDDYIPLRDVDGIDEQTAQECGSISHGPLTRPSATLSHWERHGSFEKALWVRGRQLNKFDLSLNFFATK